MSSPQESQDTESEPVDLANPIEAYYRHKAQNNLRVLYRFAIQSRSLSIRDVFAKASSSKNLDLADLLGTIENNPVQELANEKREALSRVFNSSILLVLSDLLANTARDDVDTSSAVKIYDFVFQLFGVGVFSEQQLLLYAEQLNDIGKYKEADHLAEKYSLNDIAPLQRELLNLQRVRFSASSISDWLSTLNELYEVLGLSKVRLLQGEGEPYLDRLAADVVQPVYGPKVSVIMPTYAPGHGIRTAVRALLEQSWRNLEIIIVNDASPQEYRQIFDELAQLDPRIRVLHQDTNQGAYVARNVGLEAASGEFITTADDDDWSHPDKLASQVAVLLNEPSVVATTSGHIRTTETLELRRLNSSAKFLQMNYSSLMFRHQILEEIGEWDTVNRGADSEFFSRIVDYYGEDRVVQLLDKPLGFSRVRRDSLTAGEMYRGFIGTPRVLYLWAIRQWKWDVGKTGQKPTRVRNTPRPYAVPSNFESGRRESDFGAFDVIYVADFFRQAKHVRYVLNEIQSLSEKGLRIGYIHLDSPRTTSPAGYPRALFQLQLEGSVTQLSLEDVAETKLLLVYDAALGMFADQSRAKVISHRNIAVERELPKLSGTPDRFPTLYSQALRNLDRTFNRRFEIVGATSGDHARLSRIISSPRLLSNSLIWHPHVRDAPSRISAPEGKPIVGFHSYGNKYRWPRDSSEFRKIYVSETYDTKVTGQIGPAIKKYGETVFKEITIVDSEGTSLTQFFEDIDFWVYYPHPKLEDQIWEPALMAMLAGKVVVVPPRLRVIYANAALYAEPSRVADLISDISQRPDDYVKQAKAGQDFVQTTFNAKQLFSRVSTLLNGLS